MESNGSTEIIITPEQWQERALRAERALYNINDQLCGHDQVYGDSGENPDDMGDLGDAIWEAAEMDLDDDVPVPEDIARATADRRSNPCTDRVLYAVYDSRRIDLGALLAVGRVGQDGEARKMLIARWRELSSHNRSDNYGIRAIPVDPATYPVPGWTEDALRKTLLESPAHATPTIVAERYTEA